MTTGAEIATTPRTTEEIQALEDWCREDEGATHYPGLSYEEGILAAIDWLSGFCDENPNGEE